MNSCGQRLDAVRQRPTRGTRHSSARTPKADFSNMPRCARRWCIGAVTDSVDYKMFTVTVTHPACGKVVTKPQPWRLLMRNRRALPSSKWRSILILGRSSRRCRAVLPPADWPRDPRTARWTRCRTQSLRADRRSARGGRRRRRHQPMMAGGLEAMTFNANIVSIDTGVRAVPDSRCGCSTARAMFSQSARRYELERKYYGHDVPHRPEFRAARRRQPPSDSTQRTDTICCSVA